MRVTHQLIKQSVLNNIQRNLGYMQTMQKKLSSGKELGKPSDDPVRVAQVMSYTAALNRNEQYQKNISAAKSWLQVTEDAVRSVEDVLQRARELALSGVNGTLSPEARTANAKEIDQLVDNLVQLGNTSYQGRYVFAGYQTTDAPFTRDKTLLADGAETSVVYHGDQGRLNWEIAPNVSIQANIDGKDLFMDKDVFPALEMLAQALSADNQDEIDLVLSRLDQAFDHVLIKSAEIGAAANGLEMAEEKYLTEELNFIDLRSQLEDIDLAESYIQYTMLENVYQASLAAGARIVQPSLLDFLR